MKRTLNITTIILRFLFKLPAKLIQQLVIIKSLRERDLKWKFRVSISSWGNNSIFDPEGKRFHIGLIMGELSLDPSKILVVNDIPIERRLEEFNGPWIPFLKSARLEKASAIMRGLQPELSDVLYDLSSEESDLSIRKILFFQTRQGLGSNVLLTGGGQALVIDGTHRLIGHYVRNQSLKGYKFFVTV